jgi:ATP synthase protein I
MQSKTSSADSGGSNKWQEDEGLDQEFKPLTAQQAQQWRLTHRELSPWRILLMQAAAGALVVLVVGLWMRSSLMAGSAAYGVLSVLLPGALFAWGLRRQVRAVDTGRALKRLMVWEAAKLGLTIAMLVLAPRLIPGLSWLVLLTSFVVTLKVYWVAAWLRLKR